MHTLGRRAGWLLLLAAALFASFAGLVASGQRGGETFFSNPSLTFTMLGGAVASIAAGVVGAFSVKHHERSVIAVVAIIVGTLVLIYAALELIFPH